MGPTGVARSATRLSTLSRSGLRRSSGKPRSPSEPRSRTWPLPGRNFEPRSMSLLNVRAARRRPLAPTLPPDVLVAQWLEELALRRDEDRCADAAAGLRISDPTSTIMQIGIVGWWLGDAVLNTATSPMATLARMPHFGTEPGTHRLRRRRRPCRRRPWRVHRIGGLSREKAWRRSSARDQLRVAVGLPDFRAALPILRRRAIKLPRRRPWRTVTGRWSFRYPIAAWSVRSPHAVAAQPSRSVRAAGRIVRCPRRRRRPRARRQPSQQY